MPFATNSAASIFDATLSPHRSLSLANFHVLLCIFLTISIIVSLPFVLLGAWPIAGFMGVDALILYIAFRANYRASRAYETVSVSALALNVAKVSAAGHKREWRFHPWWTRLRREEDEEFGLRKLALESRSQSIEIASFLGPDEKQDFARFLSRAMADARRGAQFS
jgi:uncharacterized membrane protein